MATPTSAGASPTAHSPQEEEVDVLTALPDYAEVEEVDELKALPDEEPQAATEEKPAHVGLVRVSRCLVATCISVTAVVHFRMVEQRESIPVIPYTAGTHPCRHAHIELYAMLLTHAVGG